MIKRAFLCWYKPFKTYLIKEQNTIESILGTIKITLNIEKVQIKGNDNKNDIIALLIYWIMLFSFCFFNTHNYFESIIFKK